MEAVIIVNVGLTRGQHTDSLNVLQICSAHFFKGFSRPGAFALLQNISLVGDNLFSLLMQMFNPPSDEFAIIDGFI